MPAFLGATIGGLWFSAYELLPDLDEFFSLKGSQMAGQVSVGYLQVLFQGIVIHPLIDQQNWHDAQFDSAFKDFI